MGVYYGCPDVFATFRGFSSKWKYRHSIWRERWRIAWDAYGHSTAHVADHSTIGLRNVGDLENSTLLSRRFWRKCQSFEQFWQLCFKTIAWNESSWKYSSRECILHKFYFIFYFDVSTNSVSIFQKKFIPLVPFLITAKEKRLNREVTLVLN